MKSAEHIGILTLVFACISMALKDALGTFMNVAENRGKALLAGFLDGASDIAVQMVNIVGAGSVVLYGWNAWTIAVLLVMLITSVIGTYYWTKLSTRISNPLEEKIMALEARIAELEQKATS